MLHALTGTFHGWRIVAAAATIQFLLGALQSQSFGLYIAALAHEMGWSRTSLAGAEPAEPSRGGGRSWHPSSKPSKKPRQTGSTEEGSVFHCS